MQLNIDNYLNGTACPFIVLIVFSMARINNQIFCAISLQGDPNNMVTVEFNSILNQEIAYKYLEVTGGLIPTFETHSSLKLFQPFSIN